MGTNPSHVDNLVALRRIEGQVRGVQRMVEERKYCIDILNQIYAVKGALGRVEEKIREFRERTAVSGAAVALESRLGTLRGQLTDILTRATEKHPDVIDM